MSRERKGTWFQFIVGTAIGGSAVFASVKLGIDKSIVDHFPGDSNRTENTLAGSNQEPTSQLILRLPLTEEPLGPEIIQEISQNLVSVTRQTRPEYKNHVALDGICSGFLTRSLGNYPNVVTAHHCVPSKIVSEEDGKTYDSIDEKGHSIFYLTKHYRHYG